MDFISIERKNRSIGIRQISLRRHCRFGRATELVMLLATGATLVLAAPNAVAQSVDYDQGGAAALPGVGGTGNWNTTDNNWVDGGGSTSFTNGDDATFNEDAGGNPYTVTINEGAPLTADRLDILTDMSLLGAGAQTLNANWMNVGDVNVDATVDVGPTVTLAAGSITGLGTLIVNGAMTGDTFVGILSLELNGNTEFIANVGSFITANAGTTTELLAGDGVTLLNAGRIISGITTIDQGFVRVQGGTMVGDTAVNNFSALDLDSGDVGNVDVAAGGTFDMDGGAAADVTNAGTTMLSAGTVASLTNTDGTTTVDGATVSGVTAVDGGTVLVDGGTLTGNTSVASGGTLDADSGDVSTAGTITVDAGGAFEMDGTNAGNVQNAGTTTVNAGDVGDIGNTGTLTVNDGTVDTVTNDNNATINGGTLASLDSAGTTQVNGGEVTGATTVTAGALTLDGGTLGTVDVTGMGSFTLSSGMAGAVTLGDMTTFTLDGGVADALTLAGTFALNAGDIGTLNTNTEDVTIGAGVTVTTETIIDGSTLTVDGGELQTAVTLQNGATLIFNTGSLNGLDINVGATETLDLNDGDVGTITNEGTTTLSGTATAAALVNNGNTSTINADAIVAGETAVNGGTVLVDGGALQDLTTVDGGTLDLDAGSVEDVTVTSGAFDMDGGTANDVTNSDTTTITTATVNSLTNDGGTTTVEGGGIVSTTTDVTAGTVLVDGGELQGLATVDGGVLDLDSGMVADVQVNGGGTFEMDGAASTAQTVTNAGTSSLSDGQAASLTNSGGTATVDGATITGLTQVDGGDVLVDGGELQGLATVDGGTLDLDSGSVADVGVGAGGTFDMDGGAAVGVVSAGTTTVSAGTLTGELVSTAGTALIEGTAALDNGLSSEGGALTVTGGTVTGLTEVFNGGSLSLQGGDLENIVSAGGSSFEITGGTADIVQLDGTGANTLSGGTLQELSASQNATVTGGTVQVLNGSDVTGGVFTIDGTGALDGDLSVNGAMADITGGAGDSVTGTLNLGAGSMAMVQGDASVGGLTTAAGTVVDLANNAAVGDQLTVNGDTDLGGEFRLDVDLSEGAGSADGDTVVIGPGVANGTVALTFENIGALGNIAGGIDVATVTDAGTSVTADLAAINAGSPFLEYSLETADNLSYTLQSQISDNVAGIGATVALTQSLIGTIVNRPTSPFVAPLVGADQVEDPCGYGGWGRVTGGRADSDGTYRSNGAVGTTPTELSYAGIQLGGDFACFDGTYSGWDLAFGGFLGLNSGSSDTGTGTVTTTDFDQSYAGLYVVASRGRFFADLQLRFEDTDYDVSNGLEPGGMLDPGQFALDDSYGSTATTVSGAVGYSWAIPGVDGLSFVPTAGFSVTQTETDTITIGEDADGTTLQIDDSTNEVAFVSASLSRSIIQTDQLGAYTFFGTATYYADLGDGLEATFDDNGSETPFTIDELGDYAEVSAGVNFTRILDDQSFGAARQLNASLRLDARNGDNVDSWGFTGQIRFQF